MSSAGIENAIVLDQEQFLSFAETYYADPASFEAPLLVTGQPGIGKTMMAARVAEGLGKALHIVPSLAAMQPSDAKGMPTVECAVCFELVTKCMCGPKRAGVTKWNPTDILPLNPTFAGICLVDDFLVGADVAKQGLFYSGVIFPRKIAGIPVPEGLQWMFVTNRLQDRAGCGRLLTPLLSRFLHVEVVPDAVATAKWIGAQPFPRAMEVAGFLLFRRELVSTFDPQEAERGLPYACPRSLAQVARLPRAFTGHQEMAAIYGTIGQRAGFEFQAYCKYFARAPKPESILRNPGAWDVPTGDVGLLSAIVSMLGDHLKRPEATDAEVDAAPIVMQRMADSVGTEFVVLLLTLAKLATNKRLNMALRRSPALINRLGTAIYGG